MKRNASKWLPMKTAPKDGTEILIYEPNLTGGQRIVASWQGEHFRDTVEGFELNPSAWQPLPDPPR